MRYPYWYIQDYALTVHQIHSSILYRISHIIYFLHQKKLKSDKNGTV